MTRKFYKTDEFLNLNAEWQQRLEDDGFVDIERTHDRRTGEGHTLDYNELPFTTERAVSLEGLTHPSSGDKPENWETLIQEEQSTLSDAPFGEVVSVWDLPAAEYFRRARRALAELPRNYPHRAYLAEYVETGVHRSAEILHRHGLTTRKARTIVSKFEHLLKAQQRLDDDGLVDIERTHDDRRVNTHEASTTVSEPEPLVKASRT